MISIESLDIKNESDVEQKLIYPLLIEEEPFGLGYKATDIRTKANLRKIKIEKGSKSKLYFPDYAIIINGLPLVIIEAKTPGEDLHEALREARNYAMEINTSFTNKLNPCHKVIVSDGRKIITGSWDSEQDLIELNIEDINTANENFLNFLKFVGKKTIADNCNLILKSIRKETQFSRPISLLGGKSIINQAIGDNSFGTNLALEYKYLFNPDTEEERAQIAKYAYVESKRRRANVSPIDRLIRLTIPPNQQDSTLINNTEQPTEIFTQLQDKKNKLKGQVCLLIGSVGSGKSTFVDYLKEVALPNDIKYSTQWITLDFNNVPVNKNLIYSWILTNLIESLQKINPELDFKSLSTLQSLFSKEINDFEKGPISLYPKHSEKYTNELYDLLKQLKSNEDKLLKAIIQRLFATTGKLLIVVLDNVDKRNRDEQLLMFEVANWLKNEYGCMIFLPLRDVTYDIYKKEPPLDTVIKDLVFRISPPLLEEVIQKRLRYAMREIEADNSKFYYYLTNGIQVECERNDVENYLKCISKSLFQNHFFKKLITGLSERNIRRGLEIFLNFCKSGHIAEDEILKMRVDPENYELPNHLVTKILLKGNNKYYSDTRASLKNIFHSYPAEDIIPDPYMRLAILNWLHINFRSEGPTKAKGYHKISNLVQDLNILGHSEYRILKEIEILAQANCILTETQSFDLTPDDLICISTAGMIHLELLTNLDYLSAISEDTWFKNSEIAQQIANNISKNDYNSRSAKAILIENSKLLINYLDDYRSYFISQPEVFLENGTWLNVTDISKSKKFIEDMAESDFGYITTQRLIESHPPNSLILGQINSIKSYGLFVDFGLKASGLIHISNINQLNLKGISIYDEFEIGDWVMAEIIEFNKDHSRFSLRYIAY